MANEWDKLNGNTPPTAQVLSSFVNHPLWDEFCAYIEETYGGKPVIEYSRCSVPGWNVKYRKAGRSLSTLYPMQGYFIALVVLTEPMWVEMEQLLPCLTPYVQELYAHAKAGMGQKWLMIEVREAAVLNDVQQCVALRQRKW